MLFELSYFEQVLDERTLKKGLKLFESGAIEFIGKQQGEYQFLIDKTISFSLKKRGEKILSYTCSCEKKTVCDHLAAVLFYFQQDALGLSIKKKASGKKREVATIKIIRSPFLRQTQQIAAVLKPYADLDTLNQSQIDAIYDAVLNLKKSSEFERATTFNLAILIALPAVFDWRILGDDKKLRNVLSSSTKELNTYSEHGLTKKDQEEWYEATMESIRNNRSLASESFLFLIPRVVSYLTNQQKLEKLGAILSARRFKIDYTNRFDKLLIAKLEVAIKSFKLFKTPFPGDYHPSAIEFIIAKSELDFCNHKTEAAFKRLATNYEAIRQHHSFYYSAYLDYIIEKAREKNKPHVELNYLKKSLIYNVHIFPTHLTRLIELVPKQELDTAINEIISWLKIKPIPYLFEKIAELLYSTGRLDEIMEEIRKYKNKFSLLHKVLMTKLPSYDQDSLNLYMEHLIEAMTEAGFYQFQQHVFDKTKEYIDKLPEKVAHNFIHELSEKVGRTKQISRYINKFHPPSTD